MDDPPVVPHHQPVVSVDVDQPLGLRVVAKEALGRYQPPRRQGEYGLEAGGAGPTRRGTGRTLSRWDEEVDVSLARGPPAVLSGRPSRGNRPSLAQRATPPAG